MTAIQHVALACGDEGRSDRFYRDLLGLEKGVEKVIDAGLARDIFGLDRPFKIVNYLGSAARFEIFIDAASRENTPRVDHVCLEVRDRDKFLADCAASGATVRRIDAGGKFICFIEDFDGNRFEVKEIAP